MTTTTIRTGIAAAVLLLTGVLAGCSSADAGGATSAATPPAGSTDHAVASCMRDAGYDVTDEDFRFLPAKGDTEGQQAALTKCLQEHDPAQARDIEASENDPEVRAIAEKVGKCMRAAGYADYPDDARDAASYEAPAGDAAFGDRLLTCYQDAGAKVATK
ncbi:hypothetical protein M3666_00200 [Curtobacterium sp. ODYSSEY 48 V2]|uniref:hypothetical protein n=1 Tax=unclassified Curtobacterium TaxID=257496 RepID=UPI00203B1954|nr:MULTISPECIES: hypothetical protein [unclassified Curtobacterium]MCM3503537.1 hypothetical protein [Curtobacterium sp. ODYSSEY 48 V2]MDB6428481.1 hypothetical protein [Curtobacterium sp. 20TX0008]